MAKQRFHTKDADGHEWMQIAQFVRAIEQDFSVSVSSGLVSADCRTNVIAKEHRAVKVGKRCINYTLAAVPFLDAHPQIRPAQSVIDKWKASLPPEIRSVVSNPQAQKKSGRLVLNDDEEDDVTESDDASVAAEKAKHERIKRKKAEFEFEIFKGNYIHIDDAAAILATIAVETRQAVKALIPRCAEICASLSSPHEVRDLLERETDTSLSHLHRLDQILDSSFKQGDEEENEG